MTTTDRECSVILTTHSMEEAESLCNKIGIMVCLHYSDMLPLLLYCDSRAMVSKSKYSVLYRVYHSKCWLRTIILLYMFARASTLKALSVFLVSIAKYTVAGRCFYDTILTVLTVPTVRSRTSPHGSTYNRSSRLYTVFVHDTACSTASSFPVTAVVVMHRAVFIMYVLFFEEKKKDSGSFGTSFTRMPASRFVICFVSFWGFCFWSRLSRSLVKKCTARTCSIFGRGREALDEKKETLVRGKVRLRF